MNDPFKYRHPLKLHPGGSNSRNNPVVRLLRVLEDSYFEVGNLSQKNISFSASVDFLATGAIE